MGRGESNKGEAALQQGPNMDAFTHFRQLRSACPRIVSPTLDTDGALVGDVAQKRFAGRNFMNSYFPVNRVPSHKT